MWIIIADFVAAAVACLGTYWYICLESRRTAHSESARAVRGDSDEYYGRVVKEPHGTE